MGHVIENWGIFPSSDRIKAVANAAVPRNIKDFQSFLGLARYFRKFVEGYALIIRPLTDLLKKNSVFRIGQKELEVMNNSKQTLISEPVLRLYDREAETEVHTDASKYGFGAALMHKYQYQFHLVFLIVEKHLHKKLAYIATYWKLKQLI